MAVRGSIRHTTDGWRGGDGVGGGGVQREGKGGEGKRSRVMGLILAERIIKRYYHNGSVIQLACTYTEDSPPMFATLKGGRKEWGRRRGREEREAQINRQRNSKRNRRGKTGSTEGVSGERQWVK